MSKVNYIASYANQSVKFQELAKEMLKYEVHKGSSGEKPSQAELVQFLSRFDGIDGSKKDASFSPAEQYMAREELRQGRVTDFGWEVIAVALEDVVGTENMVQPKDARELLEAGAGVALPWEGVEK